MNIIEGCMVQLGCGWVIGPLKPYITKLNASAWCADNHTCGYGFSWTSDGKHVGNPNKIDHPLHIVKVVETEEKIDEKDRLKLEVYDRAMLARPKSCRALDPEETIRVLSLPLPVPRHRGFVNVQETDDSITYGADFQLPDDSTPGNGRFLQIRVEVPDNGCAVEVRLSVRESGNVKHMGTFETTDLSCVANMLYPVAGLQTTQRIAQMITPDDTADAK